MSEVKFNELTWLTILSFVSLLTGFLCEFGNSVRLESLLFLNNRRQGRGVFLNTGFVFSGDSGCYGVVVSPSSLSISFKLYVLGTWLKGGRKLHAPESDAPLHIVGVSKSEFELSCRMFEWKSPIKAYS